MKKLFKGSRELNFMELLDINGGYGSGSSGKPSGSGYSGSSSGGGGGGKTSNKKESTSQKKSSAAYSSTSAVYHYNDPRFCFIDGKGYSSLTGFVTTDDASKDKTPGSETPVSPIISTTSPEKGTTSVPAIEEKKPGDGIVYPENSEDPDYELRDIFDSYKDKINVSDKFPGLSADDVISTKIMQIISSDLKAGEVVYGKDGKMCDNYVQDVLTRAGVDYGKYFKGDAKKYTVTDHIKNLSTYKNYDSSTVEKGGTYVVFMCGDKVKSDGTLAEYSPHCGLLTVDKDGNCYFTDNSSSNKKKSSSNGGLGVTYGRSVSEFESQYAYSKFYYQKV